MTWDKKTHPAVTRARLKLKSHLEQGLAAQIKSVKTVTMWGLLALGALILYKL